MTTQFPEKLTYRDREFYLNTFPLTKEVLERAKLQPNGAMSSACWRGYVGSWEIKSDDMLYLTGMELKSFHEKSFAEMFADATSEGLPATWVNGTLECTSGRVIHRDYYRTVFERDAKFVIKDGKLVSFDETENEAPQEQK